MARATTLIAILNLADERLVVGRALCVARNEVEVVDRHGYMGGWLALGRHEWREQLELREEIKWVRRHGVRYHFGRVREIG